MERADRNRYLLRTYGITIDEFDAIVEAAGGCCPLCTKPFKGTPVVDHRTGAVRGVLCTFCNHRVLGRHRDPELFARTAEYLLDPPADRVLGEQRIVPTKAKKRVRENVTRGKITRTTKEAP